jgi:hypothetical protein
VSIVGGTDDRSLGGVEVREQRRICCRSLGQRAARGVAAHRIPGCRLHLDDVSSRVGKELACIRAGDLGGDLQHPQVR